MTENLPRRKPENEIDFAGIHTAVDEALNVLLHKGSREEDFDLKVELAMRTIRAELQKIRKLRKNEK